MTIITKHTVHNMASFFMTQYRTIICAIVCSAIFGGCGKSLDDQLIIAASQNDTSRAISLLNKGAKATAASGADRGYMGVLHIAVEQCNSPLVTHLLAAGADIHDRGNISGYTPLHVASLAGCDQITVSLIAAGADVNARDLDGRTALHHASAYGYTILCQYLLDNGIDVESRTNTMQVAMHQASASTIPILVASGASVNAQDANGDTPLHVAVTAGDVARVQALLVQHADTQIANKHGMTALQLARQYGVHSAARKAILTMLSIGTGSDPVSIP